MFTLTADPKLNKARTDISSVLRSDPGRTSDLMPMHNASNQAMLRRQSAGSSPNIAARPSQTIQSQRRAEAPGIVHDVLNSPGRQLDTGTRGLMETSFGKDFGSVRIHTGSRAANSAAAINAQAYAVGNNLVFGKAQYAPNTSAGMWLLAHELTHVVQQQSGARMIRRYDESTKANTKLGEFAAGASLIFPPALAAAAYCLSNLEKPMIDITFNRWIADACSRKPSHIMHSREWDAFGHCWIGCEGSRKCGFAATATSGTVREFYREGQRILKTHPHDSFTQDVANQKTGRGLSFTDGTCYSLCDKAHGGGKLDLSAPVATCVDCSRNRVPCP